jgi:hypothetical protein
VRKLDELTTADIPSMYTTNYFYRGVKKNSLFDELPYRLLWSDAMPLPQASGINVKVDGQNYAWSTGNFGFRPKKDDKNKLAQNGIMAQLIYYGKGKNSQSNLHCMYINKRLSE